MKRKGEHEPGWRSEERLLRRADEAGISSAFEELVPALQVAVEQMKVALKQVIADAGTAKGTTFEAFDGELLSAEAGRYTYQFTLRKLRDVQENTRIFIQLKSSTKGRLDARAVSLVGTALVLVTREAIPPEMLSQLTLIEDTVWLLERQLEVLTYSLHETLGQFGAKALGYLPVKYGQRKIKGPFGSFVPNAQQWRALAVALGSESTFIIGPGGTGKSAVLSILSGCFAKTDLSILAVSHTNIATDHMFLEQVQAIENSGDEDLLRLLADGRIVRAGDPRHMSLLTGAYRHLTVDAVAKERLGHRAEGHLQLEQKQRELAKKIERLERTLEQHTQIWQAKKANLQPQIDALRGQLTSLESSQQRWLEGIEREIAEKEQERQAARRQLEPLVAQQEYLHRLLLRWQGGRARQADSVIQGERTRRHVQLEVAQESLAALRKRGAFRRLLAGRQHDLEVEAAESEVATRLAALEEADRAIASLKQNLDQNLLDQIGPRVRKEKAEAEKQRLEEGRSSTYFTDQMIPYQNKLGLLLNQIEKGEAELEKHRDALAQEKEEEARIKSQLEDLKTRLADMKAEVLSQAQLVATTISSLYLNPRLFQREYDVVLIDEISMVSLIGVLLAASRARHYFIASGDPMQFAPILKTECKEQERKRKMPEAVKWLGQDLLTHLGITIFDAISGTKGCVLLTEQGRMHPKILAPLNHYVYQDILTSRPETEYAPPIRPLPACPLMLVDSSTSPESRIYKPSQNESRVNEHHVDIVVALIPQILATLPERSVKEDPTVPRIGVLAPYRSQVRLMLRALRKADLAQYVHVGTVNTAQALQFEVILFDTVEAPTRKIPGRAYSNLHPFSFTFDRILDDDHMATGATRLLTVGHGRAKYKLIYIANLDHLRRHQPENPNNEPNKQRLIVELVEWAAKEGSISSLDVLH
jgi:hypothetical protein